MKKTGLKIILLLLFAAFISTTAFTTVYAAETKEDTSIEETGKDIQEEATEDTATEVDTTQEISAGDTTEDTTDDTSEDTETNSTEIVSDEEPSAEEAAAGAGEEAVTDETDNTDDISDEAETDSEDGCTSEEIISENETDEDDKKDNKVKTVSNQKKSRKPTYTAKDLKYLSAIIFCEANNHTYKSKVAVANVVLNRRDNVKLWGHVTTIKQVIYDKKWGVQFTPAYSSVNSMKSALDIYKNIDEYKGNWRYDAMKSCIKAAKAALEGKEVVPDDYFYFNAHIKASKSKCKAKGKEYKVIDSHIYY